MFNFYLPLAEEFEKVIQKHDIENWEAKKFYSKFDYVKTSSCNSEKFRRTVYIGIKILLRRGYLSVKGSPTHSKIFVYSETQKLKDLRLGKNHTEIFINEKNELHQNLYFLSIQESFVEELIYKYPELSEEIKKYKKKLNDCKVVCSAKMTTLNDLIEFL